MILFEPSKSRRFSVRIELRAHDSPAWVSTWLAALPTIASLRETGYRRDGVQNSVDRSLAECVEAEVGVALSVTEKIDRWSKSGEGDRMDSGQLLMTTTTTPTKAIRAHSNSLSPQRLNRLCTGELLPNSPNRSKADACQRTAEFPFIWSCGNRGSRDSAQVALCERVGKSKRLGISEMCRAVSNEFRRTTWTIKPSQQYPLLSP